MTRVGRSLLIQGVRIYRPGSDPALPGTADVLIRDGLALNTGMSPLRKLRRSGINVALGCDTVSLPRTCSKP